jgi:LPPG:FO 2-phospho-L-lactate transferase
MKSEQDSRSVVVLAGGVGGARFGHGMQQVVAPGNLTMIVNTGDDFDHLGLRMCTDLDTVLYTLSERENPETGWGVRGETRNTLDALTAYGEDPWFMVGDRDFATHILRTRMLRGGETLTAVTQHLARQSGVPSRIVPMTDAIVATVIDTPDGPLDFQQYFVARRQTDDVVGIVFAGIEDAAPAPGAIDAIASADLIVIAPSNPLVSIGPILAVPGMRDALIAASAPIVGISPIVGGKALKGPADRMLQTLGHEPSATGVARLYSDLIDGYVIDTIDTGHRSELDAMHLDVIVTDTIMSNPDKRRHLAMTVLGTPWSAR